MKAVLHLGAMIRLLAGTWVMWMLAGCQREEPLAFYTAPEDPPPATRPAAPTLDALPATNPADAAAPTWTVPPGWQTLPAGQMRFAAFAVDANDPSVLLTVIPLGSEAGDILANVNRWRGQIGLPAADRAEVEKALTVLEVDGQKIVTVDLRGPGANGSSGPQRVLGAITSVGGRVWFFKLSGPQSVIDKHQDEFDAFIRSIRF